MVESPKARLDVARKAMNDAERAKRYREKKKRLDPVWLEKEAARKKRWRARRFGESDAPED